MEIDLLDFVEQCRHLAKQALGKHAGEPASGGFVRWVHVVLHCFRLQEDHSFRETENRLKYMAEIREILELDTARVGANHTMGAGERTDTQESGRFMLQSCWSMLAHAADYGALLNSFSGLHKERKATDRRFV